MKKKIGLLTIVIVAVVFAFSLTACGFFGNSGNDNNNDNTDNGNNNSQTYTITVSNIDQLKAVPDSVAYYTAETVIVELSNSIDLQGAEWLPIPLSKGTFDGKGYTISNYKLNESGSSINSGLFSKNSGTIKNLKVDNVLAVPAVVDNIGAIVGLNTGAIENCAASNVSITSKAGSAGGIVGYQNSSTAINNCTVENITITSSGSASGGIAGYSTNTGGIRNTISKNCTIMNSFAVGFIVGNNSAPINDCRVIGGMEKAIATGFDHAYAGGIAGYNSSTINFCSVITSKVLDGNYVIYPASDSIEASAASQYGYAGGIAGSNYGSKAIINNCFIYGYVIEGGLSYAGGISGGNSGGSQTVSMITACIVQGCYISAVNSSGNIAGNAGGIVGVLYRSSISNVFVASSPLIGDYIGGIGASDGGTVSNAFYNYVDRGHNTVKNTGTAIAYDTFENNLLNETWLKNNLSLDFNNIWTMADKGPRLKNMFST